MRIVAAVVFAFLGTAAVQAAAISPWAGLADPAFVRIDERELPEAVVVAIAQDPAGFIWAGTQGGLARFDGYHFKQYLPNAADPNAMPDGYVRSLTAADDGLWIGTDSSGLVHFDSASETFHTWRPDPRGKRGPRSATIYALARDGKGHLWIGGDGGLDELHIAGRTFTSIHLSPHASSSLAVRALLVDRSGTLWIGTDDGLYRRDAPGSAVRRVSLGASQTPVQVRSLYEDHAGSIWAGAVDALFTIDRRRGVVKTFRPSPDGSNSIIHGTQVSIIETTPGVMWVGSGDAGISIVDVASGRVHRAEPDPANTVGLTAGRAWQFLRDRSGLIWIANYSGGLLFYNPLSHGAYVILGGRYHMAETGAITLAIAGERLWTGGTRGVLAGIGPSVPAIHETVPDGTTVLGLSRGSRDQLFVALYDKLCVLYTGTSAVNCANQPKDVPIPTQFWTVLETHDAYWIGTTRGLYVEHKNSGRVTIYRQGSGPHDLTSDLAGVLYRDYSGYMWVGTANGLNRIDVRTQLVTHFTFDPHKANSFGPGSIESILQDRTGRLWVAMNGGPLNLIDDPDGHPRFRRMDRADGLPHQNVDGLAQDAQGRIWASTDAGIANIDPATLRVRAFGIADGVFGGQYWGGSVAQAPDGTIFFGCEDGVSVIAPGAASSWSYAPPVVLTSLKIGDRAVPVGTKVELQPGARDVTAEFAALDYSAPQALQYQYMLQGFDRGWIHTDTLHRIATYTNLPPGQYVLRVRATNRLGVWSPSALALQIEAQPAWFETWWFRVLLAIVAAAAILGAMQIRTAALRRHAQELEAMVRDRTRELEEASLRDPLTGLRNRRFVMQTVGQDATLALRRYDQWLSSGGTQPHDADLLFFMIDIDHFKAVNDEFGHHAGDQVLVQLRERLQRVFREADYLVRWGGEEFLIVTRGSSRADAPEVAERVRVEVEQQPFALDNGQSVTKTVSIGFAAFPFDPSEPHAVDWQKVIDLADQALYAAKQSGRNAWRAAPEPAAAT